VVLDLLLRKGEMGRASNSEELKLELPKEFQIFVHFAIVEFQYHEYAYFDNSIVYLQVFLA
jgi:hypothetical protein